jgi:two-component system cell cycle sensor histidine kinase/response regulator CckA
LQNPYPEFWNPHSEIIRVLLIEDNPGDARLIREMLAEARGALFDLECADRPSAGLERLAEGDIDVVLLDLGLPNSQGLDTCTKVYAQAPEVPIVVLTGLDDEVMGLQAIDVGAQDYLVKGQVDSNPLARALRYAIERKRAEETLRASARQWQTTFDAISDAVSLMDLEWRILRCNVAMATFLGKPFSDIIGRPCWELVHGTSEPIEGCPFVRMRETYRKATLVLQIDDRWLNVAVDPVLDENGSLAGGIHILTDITERVRAEEALRESEERFRQFFENEPEYCYMVSPEGIILDVNSAALKALGYKKEELVGKPLQMIYAPESRPRIKQLFAKWKETGELRNEEMVIVTKEGNRRTVLLSASAVRDKDGRILHSVSVQRDITERKRAAEALRESEEKYRLLVESLQEGIWVIDQDAHTTFVNSRMAEMLGYNVDEMQGRHLFSFMDERGVEIAKHYLERRKRGIKEQHELKFLRKDGTRVYALLATSPITDDEGNYIGATAGVQDITKRKQAEEALRESEEKYRILVENQTDLVVKVDTEGRFQFVSPTYCELFGKKQEELLGKTFLPLVHEDDRQTTAKAMEDLYKPPYTCYVEQRALTKDGWRWLAWADKAVLDQDGNVVAIVGVGRDITERKRLEEQLLQSQKMEAVGRLTGGIAHDFNNLLTVIIGFSELLLHRHLDEGGPLYKPIEEIQKAGKQAASLTGQLLAFSRKQVLQPRVLDLNAVVSDMDKMLHRLIGEDIDLVTLLDPDLGPVKADPGQLEQVIVNLAINARDAMPQGGQLTIETADAELDEAYARQHIAVEPGPYVMLAVSDTGVGMDEETQSHIFEPFFTTKEKGEGTGLGLATVYGIVKQSGGYIWFYSEMGQGTTFKVYLPRVEGAVEPLRPSVAPTESLQGSETILVVEDDKGVRTLVHDALEMDGYNMLEACDGQEALRVCEEHEGPIHLMVTDVVMPGISGRQLAERLKPLYPEMKVLYISGYTDKTIVRHGVLEPGLAFLQKPFPPGALARKVREVLDAPQENV